ncbi:MAG: tripartite tricarboxylate transporter TctB family protein [Nevskia sp.]|nr:tripartite tricarboxylate transporter TctB family protein [Nevskia sp.]
MSSQPQPVPQGRVRFTSTVALSLTFLVIFSAAVIVAQVNYPAEAASMPLIIGGIGAALSLLQVIVELRASRGAYEEQIDLRKDMPIYLWVWSFVGAVVAFGFVIAAPLMLFGYLKFRSRESWWLSLILAASVLALLYGLFQIALGVPLFEGLVTPLIKDWLFPSEAGG